MSADWNDRAHGDLELQDGLNLLTAGDEDWPGVLRATLFGPDGREADLLRGEIVCRTPERTLTIARETDPVGFRATDENGVPAEDVTAENCGEVLTGVSGDVYANLAFLSEADEPDLRARLERSQARWKELKARETALNRKIRDIDSGQAETPDSYALAAAYAAMKNKLEEDRVPQMNEISRLRGAIINIMTAGRQLDKAEAEQEAAEAVLAAAKADVDAMPFAGMTPDEAEQSPLKLPFKPVVPQWLPIAFGAVVALGALFLFRSPGAWYPVLWVLFVALGIGGGWGLRKYLERWEVIAAQRRERREEDLIQYAELYRVMEEAQAAADIKISAADSLRESLSANERGILREIHRFAPEVSNMQEADEQLRLCAKRRKELSIAEAVVRKAEALEAQSGLSAVIPAVSIVRDDSIDKHHVILTNLPDASGGDREKLAQALQSARDEREALRLEIRRDKKELAEKSAEALESVRRALESVRECEKLSEEEDFPTDFAARIAEIFRALTDGQYEEENMFTTGSVAALLSGPGADALKSSPHLLAPFRLAVGLACFERVLSGDARPPLVLRDALRGFDERSRAASMRFLADMAKNRQILLFASDG